MSYTAKYIATTDLTDSLARDFVNGSDTRIDKWMENTDLEVECIALQLGVQPASIYTPVNYKIKEYAVCYFYFLLFQNCYAENDVEISDNEAYYKKLEWYQKRCAELKGDLTAALFTMVYTSLTPANFVSQVTLMRA
jgi:hypothetical protein